MEWKLLKPCKDGKYPENLDSVFFFFCFSCLTAEEGATVAKRHLIINAAGLIQHKYF